jgi:glycosyltransferase involved in cell wall biosynthesis
MDATRPHGTDDVIDESSTEPRRVLVVTHNYPPHVGGLEVVAQTEARGLVRSGWQVKVITSACGFDQPRGGTVYEQGTEVIRKAAWNGLERFGVPFPIFAPSTVMTMWRSVKWATLVHIHDTLYISSWMAAVACWLLGRPYVVTKHVVFVPHPSKVVRGVQLAVHRLIGRHLLSRARAVYAINPAIEADIVALQQEIKPKTLVLLNGIDTERFRPAADAAEVAAIREKYGLPPDQVLVLFAGRLVPKKRLSVLLDCDSANYRVVIAGGHAQNDDESQSGNIFLGRLDQAQMADIYRAVNIFVCPSISEFLPLTVLEAAASGLTVVVEDDQNISTSVLGKVLVRVPDIEENLSDVLDELATDPGVLDSLNAEAVRIVADHFSLTTHLRMVESAYREVIRNGNEERPLDARSDNAGTRQ